MSADRQMSLQSVRRVLSLLVWQLASVASAAESGSPIVQAKPAPDEHFAAHVWTVLQDRCLACHGRGTDGVKGGLDLRTAAAALAGGESGQPAYVAGKPDESPLWLAVTRQHDDWSPMPPKENDRLSEEQIAALRQWIVAGAAWPDEPRLAELIRQAEAHNSAAGVIVKTVGGLAPEWTNRRYQPAGLWAYQPVAKPKLSPAEAATPIDALIARHQIAPPAARAERRTLLRRATFDLLGLPPTPAEVCAFVDDPRPDAEAFAAVVERLLASPHYGEQWGRHWLDVVRYADSSGFANDYARGNAWRYRDYVVRSFNQDKPFDQFLREQLAGDELAAEAPAEQQPELLVATGFLRMGPWELTGMEVAKIARQRFLDDVTNSVGETFLAHSLQCARCHDHKFDPVATRDYYSIQAVFATTQLAERPASFLTQENRAGFDEQRYLVTRRAEYEATLERLNALSLQAGRAWLAEHQIDATEFNEAVAAVTKPHSSSVGGKVTKNSRPKNSSSYEAARKRLQDAQVPDERIPPRHAGFGTAEFGLERVARKGLERLKWELDRYEPVALSVYSGRTPELTAVYAPLPLPANRMSAGELEETCILTGGDPFAPAAPVTPGVLSVIDEVPAEIPTAIEGRRRAFADWVADGRNPLTTRAIVNRIWLWHFGQAIAGNPNNFGSTGKRPTHPELLDWLAATLVDEGWSLKALHRHIMRSDAYCRAADFAPQPVPEKLSREELERSYSVFRPRRLTAEELRDAMLCTSGELNPTLGGIPNRPEINLEVALQPRQVMGTFAAAWVPNPRPAERHRRSLYALKIRGLRDPFLEVFNEPGPDFSCEAREVSTVTPQVFSLFNGQASYDRALAWAARLVREHTDEAACVERLYELAYGRGPTARERELCLEHWRTMTVRQASLQFTSRAVPLKVTREAAEENTGENFTFAEPLAAYADFQPDLQPTEVDARTRALADVCLVILNSNEFVYVY